jgi:hypothetical protein
MRRSDESSAGPGHDALTIRKQGRAAGRVGGFASGDGNLYPRLQTPPVCIEGEKDFIEGKRAGSGAKRFSSQTSAYAAFLPENRSRCGNRKGSRSVGR